MHPAPVPKGCLISVSRRGAGSGGRDYDLASEMRCGDPAAQAALVLACLPHAGLVMDGRRNWLPSQERRRVPGPYTVENSPGLRPLRTNGRPPGRVRSKPIKHRARDALGLADLRHALPLARTRAHRRGTWTSTSLDVARRRGPRVQLGPWRPARPSDSFQALRTGKMQADPSA
jgi:hypothetical protein